MPTRGDQPDAASDPIARMMDLILAYCRSQGVGAIARLGIPDLLTQGPLSCEQLAEQCGADREYLGRMLRALAVEGVLDAVDDDTFALNELSAGLTTDHPRSVRWLAASMCDHAHWHPWGKAFEVLVEGKSQTRHVLGASPWEYLSGNPEEAGRFGQAMSNMSSQAIAGIAEVYDFGRFRHICDVGGSRGTLVLELLERYADLRATVLDLEPVIEVSRAALAGHEHEDRVEFVAGSFFESVPSGADAYILKHILHDWPDEDCLRILKCIRAAIPDDGTLLVFDALLVPEAPPWAFWLDVHMMVLQDGKERTPAEFEELFNASGFRLVRAQPIPSPVAIIEARPVSG